MLSKMRAYLAERAQRQATEQDGDPRIRIIPPRITVPPLVELQPTMRAHGFRFSAHTYVRILNLLTGYSRKKNPLDVAVLEDESPDMPHLIRILYGHFLITRPYHEIKQPPKTQYEIGIDISTLKPYFIK